MNIEDVLNDFSASYWLKNALSSALQRDPLDATRDAELLARLLRERADALLTRATRENNDRQGCNSTEWEAA